MLNGVKKRLLVMGAICLCIIGTSVPVCAQTVGFNITVGKTNSPDPISKRATKADNEQKTYITATGCAKGAGDVRACSRQLNNGRVFSGDVIISSNNIGRRQSAQYWAKAPKGVYYYMETIWGSGASTINLLGRYTP